MIQTCVGITMGAPEINKKILAKLRQSLLDAALNFIDPSLRKRLEGDAAALDAAAIARSPIALSVARLLRRAGHYQHTERLLQAVAVGSPDRGGSIEVLNQFVTVYSQWPAKGEHKQEKLLMAKAQGELLVAACRAKGAKGAKELMVALGLQASPPSAACNMCHL